MLRDGIHPGWARTRLVFRDAVPVGQRLLAFGAISAAVAPGANADERAANLSRMLKMN
jgi:hypothetical protein